MRTQNRTVEQELARIAGAQHGVVTRRQLLRDGVSKSGIGRRLRKGALLPEYPGVYRVGHRAPSVEARYLAAVRACGEGAVLSGGAAAHLLRILKGLPPAPEVTARTERRSAHRGDHHPALAQPRSPRLDNLARHPGYDRCQDPGRSCRGARGR